MTLELLIKQYGLLIALTLWFAYRELWPFLRDKLWPQLATERQAAADKATRREDQFIELLEKTTNVIANNTNAILMVGGTIGEVKADFGGLRSDLQALHEDMAGIYTLLKQPRPSRQRKPHPQQTPQP